MDPASGQHGGVVVSIIAIQQEGLDLDLLASGPFCVASACSPCTNVGVLPSSQFKDMHVRLFYYSLNVNDR